MNYEQMIKEAYAYGASIALQEAGYEKTAADGGAVKLANVAAVGNKLDDLLLKLKSKLQAGFGTGTGHIEGGRLNPLQAAPYEGAVPAFAQTDPYKALGLAGAAGAGLGAGGMALAD